MYKWMLLVASLIALGPFAGCSDDYDSQLNRLTKYMHKNQIGSGRDMWLAKTAFNGEEDRIALVFGFADDNRFCREIAELYMSRYPRAKYHCVPAN